MGFDSAEGCECPECLARRGPAKAVPLAELLEAEAERERSMTRELLRELGPPAHLLPMLEAPFSGEPQPIAALIHLLAGRR